MKPRLKLHLNGDISTISNTDRKYLRTVVVTGNASYVEKIAVFHKCKPSIIYGLLSGHTKGLRGLCRKVAERLGLPVPCRNRSYVHPTAARTPEPQEGPSVRAADGVGTIHGGATA
jgi:hypothetical protein